MTEEQAQEIIQHLKNGKRYEDAGAQNYTGDYTLTVMFFRGDAFHIETYDCHNDTGEFLIRSSERDEEGAIRYLKLSDYESTLRRLR